MYFRISNKLLNIYIQQLKIADHKNYSRTEIQMPLAPFPEGIPLGRGWGFYSVRNDFTGLANAALMA